MAPTPRPLPRFIADNSLDGAPYGRFAEMLATKFRAACEAVDDLPAGTALPEKIEWFPERTWGGRVWVPASVLAESDDGTIELYGHVSYVQPDGGEPTQLRATADFTDVLASDNPDWRIDLNDDVIGSWRGEAGQGGDVTLVWGRPLVRGAVAVTAELEGETVDQEALSEERFTLVATDALQGFGEPVYLVIKIWNKRAMELASESLYESDEEEPDEAESTEEESPPSRS